MATCFLSSDWEEKAQNKVLDRKDCASLFLYGVFGRARPEAVSTEKPRHKTTYGVWPRTCLLLDMAALCGLKILLLWVGLFSLVDFSGQDTSVTAVTKPQIDSSPDSQTSVIAHSAVTSNETSPTNSPTSKHNTSQAKSTQQPSSAPPSATAPNATTVLPEVTTKATPAPQCSYSVEAIKFGFKFIIRNSNNGRNRISVNEEGQPQTVISSYSQKILNLKPCTTYEHNVTFLNGTGEEQPCLTKNKILTTIAMNKSDITNGFCKRGYVCYWSQWNIRAALLRENTIQYENCSGQEAVCIKPKYTEICSNLTTNFTSGKCMDLSFTKNLDVNDFLDPAEINSTFLKELPTKIKTNLPPKCNLTTEYSCKESGSLDTKSKNVSDLDPFTNYTCTGDIKSNNVTINTTMVNIRIDCDIKIDSIKGNATNTSIELSWRTSSMKCLKVFPDLMGLTYNCNCSPKNDHQNHQNTSNSRSCIVKGLQPYTNYTCTVQPVYKNNFVTGTAKAELETQVGIPQAVGNVKVIVTEQNLIIATCKSHNFNGPSKEYRAVLSGGGHYDSKTHHTCHFEFRDLSYSTEYILEVTAFNGILRSKPHSERVTTGYNEKALIGFLIFLIILTSVALLLVAYKIFVLKRRKSHDLSENLMLISPASDEENLLSVEPIAVELLLEAHNRKLADDGRLFLAEFQSIPRIFSRYLVKDAKKPCNTPKNRYVDILPYDYNRVQLTTGNGETGCDYINASFIDGFKECKKYIAAQGPKEETVCDFWRMIWEQQSSIIVMVTRCEEGNRVKCAQYWPSPDQETEIYEEFVVKLNSEDHCPDYTIRYLSLFNKREKNSEREVTHIQFISWPDHGVPEEAHLLLKLRRRVNAFKNFFSGPIIVHCSAGVGRTGTYISIDAMMESLEAEGRMDIYGYIVKLRRQRCLMVQVEAQYILIHEALIEHSRYGETEISLSELHSTLSTLKQRSSHNEPTLLEEEFERLPSYKTWRTCNTGITKENMSKNRSSSVIPYDYNRVMLKLNEGSSCDSEQDDEDDEEESSDEEDEESLKYINASHINGYWGPRSFIAAQTPLPDTTADFWLMVDQKKAAAIVMFSDHNEGNQSDSAYWGSEKTTYGDIEVEVTSTVTSPTFTIRNMEIQHTKRNERRQVKQFHFLKWASSGLPEKPKDLVDMIKHIKQTGGYGNSKPERITPVIVHCSDGSSHSGLFCALWNLLDSANTEKLVDVFQVTRSLRKERQGMITSQEQYQFLYDALEEAFPVQNGEVKAVPVSAADSIQIVNEAQAAAAAEQPAEEQAEHPASTTSQTQQGAAENAPQVTDGGAEDKPEEPEKDSSSPTEKTPLGDSSNGPTVTVEV
ncbi:hypothetical protein LDENG_00116350 [Lucifuga dentata]|nr:hypothetical protein LDENG_00116350 [Lucifuga dentata]